MGMNGETQNGFAFMIQRLFTYGTLAPGRSNAHVLEDMDGTWENASARGKLYSEGWGAALGYPGIVLGETDEQVSGFLFSSTQLPDHWERLDEFEGEGYQRVLTTVHLSNGSQVEAFIYELKRG